MKIELTQVFKFTLDDSTVSYINKRENNFVVTTVDIKGHSLVKIMSKDQVIDKFKINKHIAKKL